ncbi:NACHT domain-containing NTPase [Anabaena cylindrica UHCC 0172]|uniref:NACHT domain-containing protein n=1 Tax=Anabaena cylindrica TaxID=1165 RepID=UPI002B2167E3|nr:NACHT domain-containing NTPase [Anabaena cylindrica]MEA5551867.1 NACHT domain-containing NTPase [Anabaena cylindrica UHCC 0172]
MQAKLEFTAFFSASMSLPENFLKQLEQYSELSNREKEVFIKIFGSGKSRVQVTQTLNISDSNLNSCLTGIYKKFKITGNGPVKENRLREYLEKRFSQLKFPINANADIADNKIDDLVQEIRALVKPHIKEKCGTMRVLDMAQPIELTGERGIYTNVNILEKLNRSRRIEIAELLQNCKPEEFDRFGLSRITEKRVSGLEAVQRHSKLMVLGKPGAGKSTFLKYLAMHCIKGEFLTNKVPFFITLKELAEKPKQPDLLEYFAQQLSDCNVKDAENKIDKLLRQGRTLILLDGLNEVREEDTKRILNQILEISDQFYTNQFLITCRIASKEYTFERFSEVEIDDFDQKQIATFAQNWFRLTDPVKAERFIERLEENRPIYELARNPLLLTLLCLVFGENNDFPANRSELYEEGLDILLKRWDAKRNIERDQVYKNLSLHRKEDLLSQIALTTFEQGDYFFKQKTVERYIADFIYNLPDTRTEAQELELDSEAVLKSIESQHGLLVERARGIYSFSHLTFHEYFTAKEIVANSAWDSLVEHITETRWREVFLLTVGMMRKADDLLLLMKQKIDELVAKDEKVLTFFIWLLQKSHSVKCYGRLVQTRLFYLHLEYIHNFQLVTGDQHFELTDYFNVNTQVNHWMIDKTECGLDNYYYFFLDSYRYCNISSPNNAMFRDIDDMLIYEHISELKEVLEKVKSELPNPKQEEAKFQEIWLENSNRWWTEIRNQVSKYHNIFRDWQFSDEQDELLLQYYDANLLLIDCLNSDCYVSREVRQYIEDNLLLPMSEIEKRNNDVVLN